MRLMRKQNGMIVPMKVSRWSISVWITDLKNSIGFLFFLLIFYLVVQSIRSMETMYFSILNFHKWKS